MESLLGHVYKKELDISGKSDANATCESGDQPLHIAFSKSFVYFVSCVALAQYTLVYKSASLIDYF